MVRTTLPKTDPETRSPLEESDSRATSFVPPAIRVAEPEEAPPSLSKTRRAPWHERLQARVLSGVVVVVALSLATVLFAARQVVMDYSLNRSKENLLTARGAFQHLARDRTEFATAQSQLITDLPVFRAHLTDVRLAKDIQTVSALADHYREKLKADFCIVTNADGKWIGRSGWESIHQPTETLKDAVFASRNGRSFGGMKVINGGIYLIVSEPALFAGEVLGTLTSGFRMDDHIAHDLADATQCEVSFMSGDRLSGSSLRGEQQEELKFLAKTLSVSKSLSEMPVLRSLGDQVYVSGIFPLIPGGSATTTGQLLLLQSWTPTQRFIGHVENTLLLVGAIMFALCLAGGAFFSRRVTGSLRGIADAAEEIAAGEWERQAVVQGSIEERVTADAFNQMTAHLRHYYQELQSKSERLGDALYQLEDAYANTLQALTRALDARDNETEGHSQRVADYAIQLATRLDLPEETRRTLKLGGVLHDIGKIGVPDAILRKPGKLTDEEMQVMRRHCEYGLEIVKGIPQLDAAAVVIGTHHERFDGNGYPNRLAGEDIPLIGRIFAVADTLDAMTSDRPYRKAGSFNDAMEEIRRCSGSHFDPRVVEALEALYSPVERE